MPVGDEQQQQSDTLSPTSPSGSGSRSSLGLIATSPSASAAASAAVTVSGNAGSADDKRRRAGRRQSEDTMRAMRSLDRQYGRRRRLNTDQSLSSSSSAAALVAPTNVLASGSRPPRAPQRRGDSRALFAATTAAPLDLSAAADTTLPSVAPTLHSPVGSVAGSSARLARQLIMIAGKLAQAPGGAVRPRASMPLIGASATAAAQQQQPLQRQQQQRSMRRKNRDELADALTMKSVEIRGGRIVLDDPSSSDDDEYDDEQVGYGSAYGGAYGRASVGSVATHGAAAAEEAAYWEEALRRRWYARRCLGLRQPFASAHRLAQAEHASAAPFPLLSDVRRLVHESPATIGGSAGVVLVCSDALVLSSAASQGSEPLALRVVEYADDMRVAAESDHVAVVTDEQGDAVRIGFAGGGAAAWAALVEQARVRMCAAMQDLRLDEEDFVERPPAPLLLTARGRGSIAGTTAAAAMAAMALGPTASSASLGRQGRPVHWVPDGETAVCMVCRQTAFSMMVRRHHCRACGLVICYRCSTVGQDRFRLCVNCSAPGQQQTHVQRRAGSLGAAFMSAAAAAMSTAVSGPKPSPSLHTLGRRAAEYVPPGDVVMQVAAAQRKPDGRLARRPLSSLFPVDGADDIN
ncbi:hypothetical protein LPJ53_004144 [Coemansia erecta]|uniref:FYVE-type domain-containing protein n=1 Tax=Coemansia erecta TaxID=147472 RepID=A0A9W7Y0G6_9FUNG|nr:hypothetical protein LPJ53_004144 [Coemansia erecta]